MIVTIIKIQASKIRKAAALISTPMAITSSRTKLMASRALQATQAT